MHSNASGSETAVHAFAGSRLRPRRDQRLGTREGGPRVALYVIRSLVKAIRLLAQSPQLGHLRTDLTQLPLKFWPVFSYLIVYDPARRPIEVIRVLHAARNIEQILSEHN
jgi:toxin ParE1/3/4